MKFPTKDFTKNISQVLGKITPIPQDSSLHFAMKQNNTRIERSNSYPNLIPLKLFLQYGTEQKHTEEINVKRKRSSSSINLTRLTASKIAVTKEEKLVLKKNSPVISKLSIKMDMPKDLTSEEHFLSDYKQVMKQLGLQASLISGAQVATGPANVVKAKMQKGVEGNALVIIKKVFEEEGLAGLYAGGSCNWMKSLLNSFIVMNIANKTINTTKTMVDNPFNAIALSLLPLGFFEMLVTVVPEKYEHLARESEKKIKPISPKVAFENLWKVLSIRNSIVLGGIFSGREILKKLEEKRPLTPLEKAGLFVSMSTGAAVASNGLDGCAQEAALLDVPKKLGELMRERAKKLGIKAFFLKGSVGRVFATVPLTLANIIYLSCVDKWAQAEGIDDISFKRIRKESILFTMPEKKPEKIESFTAEIQKPEIWKNSFGSSGDNLHISRI